MSYRYFTFPKITDKPRLWSMVASASVAFVLSENYKAVFGLLVASAVFKLIESANIALDDFLGDKA